MSSAENRKSPRVSAPHVLVKISSRDRFRSSYLKDLSEGGLFVKTDKALPEGAALVIDLLPPGWTDTLRLKGVVVRAQTTAGNSGMAVRFENNDDTSMGALRTLVNDYQSGAQPELRNEDSQEQLQKVLGQLAETKNTLEKRETELAAERTRREEATKKAVVLTAELEIAKSIGGGGGDVSEQTARLKELETELATSQHEEMELRTRLAEVEGELEAFKHEIETLEQDDSTSRRLASGLAKEKAELTAENGKLTSQLNETKQKLKDANRLAEEQAQSLESREKNERHLTEKLRVVTTEADDLRMKSSELEVRANELEGERDALKQSEKQASDSLRQVTIELDDVKGKASSFEVRAGQLEAERNKFKQTVERLEQELATTRTELTTVSKRVSTAEATAKEAVARAERSRIKERELRDLMAMVTGKPAAVPNDDVVVFEEKPPSLPAAAPAPPPPAPPPVEAAPPPSPPPPAASPPFETEIDLDVGVPQSMPSVSISFESSESMSAAFQESPSGIELSVDVDVDDGPTVDAPDTSPPPPAVEPAATVPVIDRASFERRLRGNEPLAKTEKFDSHSPRDDRERSVLGLLQAGGRFSELMVLGRGVVAPAELIDALYTLSMTGVVRFEEPKK